MKVFLYALSTCFYCRQTKKFMEDNGIEFEHVDVDLAEQSEKEKLMKEVIDLTGAGKFPVIKIGEQVVVGYDEDKLKDLLIS